MASQEERYCKDVVPGCPLCPVAPLCHTAGLSAVLDQKERSRYASMWIFVSLCICDGPTL